MSPQRDLAPEAGLKFPETFQHLESGIGGDCGKNDQQFFTVASGSDERSAGAPVAVAAQSGNHKIRIDNEASEGKVNAMLRVLIIKYTYSQIEPGWLCMISCDRVRIILHLLTRVAGGIIDA
jgi:hypothetical protein